MSRPDVGGYIRPERPLGSPNVTGDGAGDGAGDGDGARGVRGVATSGTVAPGAIVPVSVGDIDLVVFRTGAGEVRVCEARCPHQWNHLAAVGQVEDDEIVCAVHFWRFDRDGRGSVRLSDGTRVPTRDLTVYPSIERDGEISVRITP